MFRSFVCAVAFAMAVAGCGDGVDAAECRAAATAQAEAEAEWASVIEQHDIAHVDGVSDHSDLEESLLTRRIDMVVATEATRRACQ